MRRLIGRRNQMTNKAHHSNTISHHLMNLQWTTLNTPQLSFCRIAFQLFNRDKSEGGLQRTMLPVDRGGRGRNGCDWPHPSRNLNGNVIDTYPPQVSVFLIREDSVISVSCPIHRTTRLIEEGDAEKSRGGWRGGGMYHSASNNGGLGDGGETLNAWWDSFCEGRFCPGGCWSFCGVVMRKAVGCSVCGVGIIGLRSVRGQEMGDCLSRVSDNRRCHFTLFLENVIIYVRKKCF